MDNDSEYLKDNRDAVNELNTLTEIKMDQKPKKIARRPHQGSYLQARHSLGRIRDQQDG